MQSSTIVTQNRTASYICVTTVTEKKQTNSDIQRHLHTTDPRVDIITTEHNISKLEIILMLLRQIGILPPTVAPGEKLCIKIGSQIGGWVFSGLDHVIHAGQKYTISSIW